MHVTGMQVLALYTTDISNAVDFYSHRVQEQDPDGNIIEFAGKL